MTRDQEAEALLREAMDDVGPNLRARISAFLNVTLRRLPGGITRRCKCEPGHTCQACENPPVVNGGCE